MRGRSRRLCGVLWIRGKREMFVSRFHTRSTTMLSTGCDLHKQTITICVVNQMRIVILRRTLACADEEALRRFFEELRQWRRPPATSGS